MGRLVLIVMLLIVVILGAACGGDADTSQQASATTATSATTTPTTLGTTAAAKSQDVVLTFDGEQCNYEGPSEAVLAEPMNVELINNSDVFAFGLVLWVPPEIHDEIMRTVGTDFPFSDREGEGLSRISYVEVQSGTASSLSMYVASPGTYVFDCVSAEGATRIHIWRPAAIEFSR